MSRVSLFTLLGHNSSLLYFDLLHILAETTLDGGDDVGLVSLEGVEVLAPSDLELSNTCVLLDKDGCIRERSTLLGGLLGLVGRLGVFEQVQELFGVLDLLGLSEE